MRIRIIKLPPAPVMDGFDVAQFQLHDAYDVEARLGWYLIVAGYAERDREHPESADDRSSPPGRRNR